MYRERYLIRYFFFIEGAMTINVVYALKLEDKLGSIEENKIANFSVFDVNFLREDIDKVFGNKAYAIIIDGEEVYRIQ